MKKIREQENRNPVIAVSLLPQTGEHVVLDNKICSSTYLE